ncbi:hypothetical protein KO507_11955 [Gilvimarinus agarilyticus]|uniref:DUF6694 family lipoprotein n=1 Tax=unclassified Gilvimarinus TaxID=2642066 RepID=UPI001C0891C7|nr:MULTISPECIES: DUF6694 family lipoprotein [unclassified Gilvimarinus]MBU2886478.1 hypothetical protein [Gilvimarinus agarilyticus]MDO6571157.1 hypothetical protein [Gilvimarinus sp. 2_MG-2023]MDO6748542.1 hypothetical protein [Gilvimarinus sp. 1_MG-2023]
MKHCIFALTLVFSCLLLSGCGDPTLDATNQASIEESVNAMMEEMDEQEQQKFQQALASIALEATTANIQKAMSGATIDAEQMQNDFYASLDGKTAQEVIDYAAQQND